MESASPGHAKQYANMYQLILSTGCAFAALRALVKSWRWSRWVKCFAIASKWSFLSSDNQAPSMEYTDHMRKYFPQMRVVSLHQESNHWLETTRVLNENCSDPFCSRKILNFIMVNESSKTWKPRGHVWGPEQQCTAQSMSWYMKWRKAEEFEGSWHSLVNFS